MPYSLVVNLLPCEPIQPGYLEGRHLHALFLSMVNAVAPDLATHLHGEGRDKAFALSPLQTRPPSEALQTIHSRPIPAGTPCWWRIGLLNEDLFGQLTRLWLNLNPRRAWHLGAANLEIASVLATPQSPQPWASSQTYSELLERASSEERHLSLRLCTPTCFRQNDYDTALPTAELVFGSLWKRWQKYSPVAIPWELTELVRKQVFPCRFDVETRRVADQRSKFIGCVGTVTYEILGQVTSEQIRQLNALTDFALYAGIGRKTTMGMGMARRIHP
jgi:CRISPR-associated endoribonuclease Cas6